MKLLSPFLLVILAGLQLICLGAAADASEPICEVPSASSLAPHLPLPWLDHSFCTDPRPNKVSDLPTIFVSVASYRDDQCKDTMIDIFANAEHPERIFIGLVQQNAFNDSTEDCLPPHVAKQVPLHQIRPIRMSFKAARGPTWARYIGANLNQGEDYFLQIDSHSFFEPRWDTRFIAMLHRMPSPKPVISTYPLDPAHRDRLNESFPALCEGKFNGDGVVAFQAHIMGPPKRARPVPYASANLLFTLGRALREVPFDPYTPFLFHGEEVLYAARLWTAGYDIFTPDENLMYHVYGRFVKPKYWHDLPDYYASQPMSIRRVKLIMDQPLPPKHQDRIERCVEIIQYYRGYRVRDWKKYVVTMEEKNPETGLAPIKNVYELCPELFKLERYGPGRLRTMAQYHEYAGHDLATSKSRSIERFCPDVHYSLEKEKEHQAKKALEEEEKKKKKTEEGAEKDESIDSQTPTSEASA